MMFDSWIGITIVERYANVWMLIFCYILQAEDGEVESGQHIV